MIRDTEVDFPQEARLLELINRQTRAADNVCFDALGLAETLFDNHMMANMILIGAAYQAGLMPMSAEAIEQAIQLNGIQVEANQNAFRTGRLAVADPDWLASLDLRRQGGLELQPQLSPAAQALIDSVAATGELKRLLAHRVPELIAYQNAAYAGSYVADVKKVYDIEQAVCPGVTDLSEAVARYLFKLMAYKDEYEVARLSLKAEVRAALDEQFGEGARFHYHLHPPLLKALGMRNKIKFGRWFDAVYHLLARLKGLRGTPFDIFGYDRVRRVERALIEQYRQMIFAALDDLDASNYERAVKLARLPDRVRGYDEVKLGNVERFWQEAGALGYEDLQSH